MIDIEGSASVEAAGVRVTRGPDSFELYFPPLRTPEVALALAAFGFIATALPAFAIVAFFPAALADTIGRLGAVLLAAFVVPFAVFGAACIVVAVYMLCNAFTVRVDARSISTERRLFGFTLARASMPRSEIETIEQQIAARDQSLFGSQPVYRLVARARSLLVAESLRGEASMAQVKALIERLLPDAAFPPVNRARATNAA